MKNLVKKEAHLFDSEYFKELLKKNIKSFLLHDNMSHQVEYIMREESDIYYGIEKSYYILLENIKSSFEYYITHIKLKEYKIKDYFKYLDDFKSKCFEYLEIFENFHLDCECLVDLLEGQIKRFIKKINYLFFNKFGVIEHVTLSETFNDDDDYELTWDNYKG